MENIEVKSGVIETPGRTLSVTSAVAIFEQEFMNGPKLPMGERSKYERRIWSNFRESLRAHDIHIPEDISVPAINIALSIKHGQSIGWNFVNLVSLANHVFNFEKRFLVSFGWMLKASGLGQTIDHQDSKRTWQAKKSLIREGLINASPEYAKNTDYDQFFSLINPNSAELLHQPVLVADEVSDVDLNTDFMADFDMVGRMRQSRLRFQ